MSASLSATPFSLSQSQGKPTYAVIGAGVVGLCVALEAQRQGYQVTLLDGNEPGRAASFGNAGYLATEVIEPLATPATVRNAPKLWLNPETEYWPGTLSQVRGVGARVGKGGRVARSADPSRLRWV